MDRILESFGLDMQADSLAVYLVAQCGVAVTGEAFINGGFGRVFFSCCG
jgi:hypothetical protein